MYDDEGSIEGEGHALDRSIDALTSFTASPFAISTCHHVQFVTSTSHLARSLGLTMQGTHCRPRVSSVSISHFLHVFRRIPHDGAARSRTMGVSGFKGNPRGAFVVGFSVLVAVLDTSAVALRFAARRRSKADFAADDWWILSSLIPLYCMIGAGGASKITIPRLDVAPLTQACRQVTSVGGLGRSVNDLSPQQISTFLKVRIQYNRRNGKA